MRKAILILASTLTLALSFGACGGGDNDLPDEWFAPPISDDGGDDGTVICDEPCEEAPAEAPVVAQ